MQHVERYATLLLKASTRALKGRKYCENCIYFTFIPGTRAFSNEDAVYVQYI